MRFFTIVLLSTLFIFVGCENKKVQQGQQVATQQEQKIKFPLALTTLDDENITINKIDRGFTFSNTDNEAVLLNFFATWCPPCKAEIPHFNNLQKKYDGKLKIISVLMEDKNTQQIKEFVKKYDIGYIVTQGSANFDLAKAIGDVQAIPFTILYDKNGKYATHYTGAIPEEMLDVDILKVIK